MSHSYEELHKRAEALVPVLKKRAARCEELRCMPDETVRDLHDTGLFRFVQPKRVGGSELEFASLVTLPAVLARGCASTAWNFVNLGSHHLLLGMYPKEAQDDVWKPSPDTLVATSFVFPAGRAKKVAGGYVLSGRWPFSSGVDHSDWNMLAGMARLDDNTPAEQRVFLVHKSQYVIHDTWYAGGLRGTGSKDVEVKEQFIPDHRTLAVADTKGGESPGSAANPGPIYRMPVFALFPYFLSGVALGIAEGMIDGFTGSARERTGKMTAARVAEIQSTQIRVGEATALARASRLAMVGNCREAQQMIEAGGIPDVLTRARYRLEGAWAVEWAVRAVDVMFGLAGASGLYETGETARAFRDAHAIRQHFSFNTDIAGTTYGRVALGLPSDNATI